jgi:hypothetical protein
MHAWYIVDLLALVFAVATLVLIYKALTSPDFLSSDDLLEEEFAVNKGNLGKGW